MTNSQLHNYEKATSDRGWDDPDLRERMLLSLYPSLSKAQAKKQGIFYTPPCTARHMVQTALAPIFSERSDRELFQIKLLDPSCGIGIFLIEAFFLFVTELQRREIDTAEHRCTILERCLFGLDLDQHALARARMILNSCWLSGLLRQSESTHRELRLPLYHCHALFDVNDLDPEVHEERDILERFPLLPIGEILGRGTEGHTAPCDCIIGNPPYGLSRGDQLLPSENAVLKRRYREFRSGKLNKYLAFMGRSLELLKDRGTLSFIVPNAWLGIRDGEALRTYLCRSGSLHSLELYHNTIFPHLGVETVVFYAQKNAAHSAVEVRSFSKRSHEQPERKRSISYAAWRNEPEHVFPLTASDESEILRLQLEKYSIRLDSEDSLFNPRIALQAYAVGKGVPPQTKDQVKQHVFHTDQKISDRHYPYIVGRDIERFRYSLSGTFLHHGAWLAEPQTIDRFCGPRIIVREILNAPPHVLSAAYIEESALYNKSVLHILPRPGCKKDDLLALLAILNSSFAGIILQLFGRKSQRQLFPKIVNHDLKSFPLPTDWNRHVPTLAALSAKLSNRSRQAGKNDDEEKQLECAVLQAYSIAPSLVQAISDSLDSFRPS